MNEILAVFIVILAAIGALNTIIFLANFVMNWTDYKVWKRNKR